MKIFISLVLACFTLFSYAQVRVYEDLNANRITAEEFWKHPDRSKSIYAYRASADTVITFLYDIKYLPIKGTLSNEVLERMKEIFDFGDKKLPIVIQYFPGVDDCSKHYISRKSEMLKFLRQKNGEIRRFGGNMYTVYKSNKNVEDLSEQLNWQLDQENFIESLFFEHHFPCGSYIVINQNGEYRGWLGEYSSVQIKEDFKKLK